MKAMYPGTFDPPTFGHLDVVRRGALVFDHLTIAVAKATPKDTLFDADERVEMFEKLCRDLDNVEVVCFDGLMIEFAQSVGASVILRGLRTFSDFEYEFQLALANRKLLDCIETMFIMPSEDYAVASSGLAKEIIKLGGDAASFVPAFIEERVQQKINSQG